MPDGDGYPTKAELQRILKFKGTPAEFVDYIDSIWWDRGFMVKDGRNDFREPVKRLYLSTWGWSGNEDIIGVLHQTWFRLLWWKQYSRGGHYIYEIPKDKFNVKFQFAYGLPRSKVEQ